MLQFREEYGINLKKMSKIAKTSVRLLSMVETGDVTHPNIVDRIRKAYKLSKEEAYDLMPANYNPNGGNYDPDMYRVPDPADRDFVIKKTSKFDEYEDYYKNDKKWRKPNNERHRTFN